jgi:hypothetical protein
MGSTCSTIFVNVSDHCIDSIGVYMVESSCIKFESSTEITSQANHNSSLDLTIDAIKNTVIDIHKKSNNSIKFQNIVLYLQNNAFKFVNKRHEIKLVSEEKITDALIYSAQKNIITEIQKDGLEISDFKINKYLVDGVVTMNPVSMFAKNVIIDSMATYLNPEFAIMASKIIDITGIKIDKILPYQMSLYHSIKNNLHNSKKSIIVNINRYKSNIIIGNKNDIMSIGSINLGFENIYTDIIKETSLSYSDISTMIEFSSMKYNPSSYGFDMNKFTSILKSSSASLLNKIMMYINKTSGKTNYSDGVFIVCDKIDVYSLSQIINAHSEYKFFPINNQNKMQNALKYYIFSKASDFELDKYRKNINSLAVASFFRATVNRIYTFLFTL